MAVNLLAKICGNIRLCGLPTQAANEQLSVFQGWKLSPNYSSKCHWCILHSRSVSDQHINIQCSTVPYFWNRIQTQRPNPGLSGKKAGELKDKKIYWIFSLHDFWVFLLKNLQTRSLYV